MLSLTRPKFVSHARRIPAPGVAFPPGQKNRYPRREDQVVESGQVIEINRDAIRLGEVVGGGNVLVDGLSVGDIAQLFARSHLRGADGFLVALVAIDRTTGEVVADPEILTRDLVYVAEWMTNRGGEGPHVAGTPQTGWSGFLNTQQNQRCAERVLL